MVIDDEVIETSEESTSVSSAEESESASTAEESTSDSTGAEESSSESGSEDTSGLGRRAQKRIGDLTKRANAAEADVKRLKKELETAKRLGGDDGKAFLAAAEQSGILPGLMSKDEAKAFSDLAQLPAIIKGYKKWLNDHDKGDELEMGDKTMSYGDVRNRLDEIQEEFEDLKDKYGERQKELRAKVKEIFQLGEAAMKAGWKPGAKAPAKNVKPKTRPGSAPQPKPVNRSSGKRADEIEVNNEDDLEAYMAAKRREKK